MAESLYRVASISQELLRLLLKANALNLKPDLLVFREQIIAVELFLFAIVGINHYRNEKI